MVGLQPSTTLNKYGHLVSLRSSGVIERLDAAIFGEAPEIMAGRDQTTDGANRKVN
jgi:hypothetical protein